MVYLHTRGESNERQLAGVFTICTQRIKYNKFIDLCVFETIENHFTERMYYIGCMYIDRYKYITIIIGYAGENNGREPCTRTGFDLIIHRCCAELSAPRMLS